MADPDFYVVDDHYGDDRRILIEPKTSALSSRWLEDLAFALRQFPGWDVLVTPGDGISLLVRDGTVWCIGWVSEADGFAEVISELRRYIDQRVARRAQIKRAREGEVSQLLPAAWRLNEGKPVVLVAAFRTLSDGTPGDSVWLLHFNDQSAFELDEYSFEPDALRPSLYWAGSSGRMTLYTPGSHANEPGGALLAEWALVEAGHPVRGTKRLRLGKGGRAWSFDLLSH